MQTTKTVIENIILHNITSHYFSEMVSTGIKIFMIPVAISNQKEINSEFHLTSRIS